MFFSAHDAYKYFSVVDIDMCVCYVYTSSVCSAEHYFFDVFHWVILSRNLHRKSHGWENGNLNLYKFNDVNLIDFILYRKPFAK